jgi:hypothetical protein
MITSIPHNYYTKADQPRDCSLGNILFVISGIIGIATKKGYSFGFPQWVNQEYFVNPLPRVDMRGLNKFSLPITYQGYDIGFTGFDVPDNSIIAGYFGSEKYWEDCEGLVRYYLTMKDLCEPYKDCVLMHHRSYGVNTWEALDDRYYNEALKHFPGKRVIVVTSNVEKAKNTIKIDCEYVSNSPIIDFYLLSHTDYLVMANSSFSWMAAYLSRAKTVAPKIWYNPNGPFYDCPTESLYCDNWIKV